jgi:hypothetical protein
MLANNQGNWKSRLVGPFNRLRKGEVPTSAFTRELLLFLAFLGLTVVMLWPWVTHLWDAVTDPGDPYLVSYLLWWDFHQTFHDPLNLFQATIFFPYRYSLAFSEAHYGIALLCFPLFAIGLRPLTVHGIATLFGFAFSGYGAFRLARTLSASNGVAWITGIAFAFVPYRFSQLPHLVYLFSGWIPILLEALVLFILAPTWKRAAWLGVAFFMNALSSITWFVLTLLPLALSGVFLLTRHRGWTNTTLWRRGVTTLALATMALVPFFVPYIRAANLYGFVRHAEDALLYSATPIHWLVGSYFNKIWHSLNVASRVGEKDLFPGLLPLLFSLAAIFLIKPLAQARVNLRALSIVLVCLDMAVVICGILIIVTTGFGIFALRIGNFSLFTLHSMTPLILTLVLAFVVRVVIARPVIITRLWQRITGSVRAENRPDAFWLGLIWAVMGFIGSLGMNTPFHRILFEYVPLFRSIRVPARWAMICYLGLALLTGLGARQLGDLLTRHWRRITPVTIYVLVAMCMLLEQRVAPLNLIHGAVDPDALALRLKQTPMRGGIVELPAVFGGAPNYFYVLRAADHARPLVTAISGFIPPLELEIESLSQERPISDEFMNLLEKIPCSYLVIHNGYLGPADRFILETFLAQAITAGRLRFVRSFDGADLYAVTRTEPNALSEAEVPFRIQPTGAGPIPDKEIHRAPGTSPNEIDEARFFVRMQYLDFLGREPDPGGLNYWVEPIERCGKDTRCIEDQRVTVSAALFAGKEFQDTGFFLYRLYRATLGRAPTYNEFKTDRAKLIATANLETGKNVFVEDWVKGPAFLRLYSSQLTSDQLVDALLRTVRETSPTDLGDRRQNLIDEVERTGSRAKLVRQIVDDETLGFAEYNRVFVSTQYFAFLNRDPDPKSFAFWVDALRTQARDADREMIRIFLTSKEYRSRFLH